MTVAYTSPHGGELLAVLDKPSPEFEEELRSRGQKFKVTTLAPTHPAAAMKSLHGYALDGDNVRRFGGN